MTPESDAALEVARRIADGEVIDLAALESDDPDLARRLAKLQTLARAMSSGVEAGASWGHLQQLQLASQGGFGAVYRAYDPTLDRIVALKLRHGNGAPLLPSGVDFVAEARRLARVRHPNVLAVHGASYHDGRAGIWTDWIEGETLAARLERAGPLRGDELLRVLRELADALDAVHEAGLVHGDIKASNVMLDLQGRVILMDFGAGFESSEEGTAISAGTPRYLAPEIVSGGVGTMAVDLYAFGVLAHLLATHRYPDSTSDRLVLDRRGLRALISRMLASDPRARPPSDALRLELKRLIELPKQRARRWLMASVVVGLVGIVLATTIGLRREKIQLQRAERVSDFLATLYREQDPLSRNAESARPPAALVADAVDRVKRELADDPPSQARLLRVLGEAQLNLSQLAAAHETLELAASKLADLDDPLLSAEVDAVRGSLARNRLRYEDAEHLFDRALRQASAAAGSDSVAVGRIKALSAATLLSLSRFKDAREATQSAYALLSKQLGSEHPETISALVSLGIAQAHLREDDEAMLTLRNAIARIETRFGTGDARLIRPLQALGEVLRREREFDEGRTVLERGSSLSQRQFGERNALLADILIGRSALENDAGDHAAAIAALDAAERALPEKELTTLAQLLASRGRTWMDLKDGKRAEPDLRAALKLRREGGGLRTGLAWFSQAELGRALALQGRFDEAQTLLGEAERELQSLLGPEAYQVGLIKLRRGIAYELQHDWRNAAESFREAIRIGRLFYGPEHYLQFSWNLALAQVLSRLPDGREEATRLTEDLILRWSSNADIERDYAELMLLRCDLHAQDRDYASARALATTTLARPGLVASSEQIDLLTRHASTP